MKKIFTAILTFTIGTFAFNFFDVKEVSTSENFTPVQKIIEFSEKRNAKSLAEVISINKVENLKPFFDSFEGNESDQGYGGWFIADNFKGMKEVWTITLGGGDENSKNEKFVWSASILTQHPDGNPNDDDDFHSVWIKAKGNHLSFRTNKIRGIEYRFDGVFFKNGKDFAEDEKVLRGTMQKIVRGKQVAKFTADFFYAEPHCFH